MESPSKQFGIIKVEREGRIGIITLNSPKTLNAFSWSFPWDFDRAVDEIARDPKMKVVVMKAEGKVFSAGASMEALKMADTPYKVKTYVNVLNSALKKLQDMPQPVICAIDGASAGGGANLVLSCDIVVASEKASFAYVFANLGLVPDTGGLWNLCRLAGIMRAKEISMRGLSLGAEEALKYGLVAKVVPSDKLYEEAMSVARDIESKAGLSIQFIKRICNRMPEMTLETYCDIEEGLLSMMFFTRDFKEGVNSFLEKRRPDFQGEGEVVAAVKV